ncbi:hypothetical protein BDZ97DRAFT_2082312 [Flammula alnicola]|nr:hypothetical protein BDZ97DRAFT_2082312 [Flammula alnicola]
MTAWAAMALMSSMRTKGLRKEVAEGAVRGVVIVRLVNAEQDSAFPAPFAHICCYPLNEQGWAAPGFLCYPALSIMGSSPPRQHNACTSKVRLKRRKQRWSTAANLLDDAGTMGLDKNIAKQVRLRSYPFCESLIPASSMQLHTSDDEGLSDAGQRCDHQRGLRNQSLRRISSLLGWHTSQYQTQNIRFPVVVKLSSPQDEEELATSTRPNRPATPDPAQAITENSWPMPSSNYIDLQGFFLGHLSIFGYSSSEVFSRTQPEGDAAEQEVIREYTPLQEGPIHSSGGGGIGNMNRSRSCDLTSTLKFSTDHSRLAVAELAISYQAPPMSRNPWTRRSAGNTSTTPPDCASFLNTSQVHVLNFVLQLHTPSGKTLLPQVILGKFGWKTYYQGIPGHYMCPGTLL